MLLQLQLVCRREARSDAMKFMRRAYFEVLGSSEQLPDHPDPNPNKFYTYRSVMEQEETLNALFKCFQAPVPVVW